MSRLSALRKPLTEMTEEELRAHVLEIRADRLINKERPAEKKKARAKSAKAKSSTQDLLDNMTPEEKAKLLRRFQGKDDE